LKIGENHSKNTGCLNDFLWDKSGIDLCMRAAFVCDKCKSKSKSRKNKHLDSREFSDIESILNAVCAASRKGEDILLDTSLKTKTPTLKSRFDLFLCHNSKDKPAVRKLNEVLKSGGIKTWFDEEQIKPGDLWQTVLESQISEIAACLIIVGDTGLGPWHDMERRAFISEFANRGCKVIPVLIGNASAPPELPLFLRQYMWSDLRQDDGRQMAKIIAAIGSERGQ
jgi:TIR domain